MTVGLWSDGYGLNRWRMDEKGLISVEYSRSGRVALFVYEAGTAYDLDDIKAYVAIMSEGRAQRIIVYEGDLRVFDIKL